MKTLTSDVGEYLSSRAVASQVLSARQSLTSVFGMGTGGPSALITPTYRSVFSTVLSIPHQLHFVKYQSALVPAPLDMPYSGTTYVSKLFGTKPASRNQAFPNRLVQCTFRDSNPGPTD